MSKENNIQSILYGSYDDKDFAASLMAKERKIGIPLIVNLMNSYVRDEIQSQVVIASNKDINVIIPEHMPNVNSNLVFDKKYHNTVEANKVNHYLKNYPVDLILLDVGFSCAFKEVIPKTLFEKTIAIQSYYPRCTFNALAKKPREQSRKRCRERGYTGPILTYERKWHKPSHFVRGLARIVQEKLP